MTSPGFGALLTGAAEIVTRSFIDKPVGVAAFATTDPKAPCWLRFVLHPAQDPPPDNHYLGFCKVGEDKEVALRRGKEVTITLKDLPALGVTFAPWDNTRQSQTLFLGPSSSQKLTAVISQPGAMERREFQLKLPLLKRDPSPVSGVMHSQPLDDDECRFFNLRRLVTEYIPPVLRQLFVLRWDERHPDDKWDDSDGARREACGKKLLKGVDDMIEVPSCTFKLTKVRKEKATITIEEDTVPPIKTINLYKYAKNGVAVNVVQEDGSSVLPPDSKVDKIVSSRQSSSS